MTPPDLRCHAGGTPPPKTSTSGHQGGSLLTCREQPASKSHARELVPVTAR